MFDVQRRQSVVMSVDAVGYSLMMASDDAATFAVLLDSIRRIEQLVEGFGGRIIDTPGDNVLAELPSPASAVRCAVQIQRKLAERNRQLPEARRMHFRIGLHSGAVLAQGGRLYGNVVNVAARLQAEAAPGSVLLSEAVADQLEAPFARQLDEREPRRLKNIPDLVRPFELHVGA